jgi:hypothetical protein
MKSLRTRRAQEMKLRVVFIILTLGFLGAGAPQPADSTDYELRLTTGESCVSLHSAFMQRV